MQPIKKKKKKNYCEISGEQTVISIVFYFWSQCMRRGETEIEGCNCDGIFFDACFVPPAAARPPQCSAKVLLLPYMSHGDFVRLYDTAAAITLGM